MTREARARAGAVAAFGGLLTLVAGAFGVTSMLVPGVALVLAGGGAVAWAALVARRASVVRAAAAATVEEGEPYPVEITVRLPVGSGELSDPLLPRMRVRAGRVAFESSFARRGRHTLTPSVLRLHDPLRLAERELRSEADEVLVLPRVEPLTRPFRVSGREGARDEAGVRAHEAALEFDGLRPYRAGAPASRIHWPTVARRGAIVERRFVAEADARPLVVVDGSRPDCADALDSALRAAASLAVHLARSGGCAVVLPGERRAITLDRELRGWPAVHARLALVEPGGEPSLSRRLARGGALVWVCGTPARCRPRCSPRRRPRATSSHRRRFPAGRHS